MAFFVDSKFVSKPQGADWNGYHMIGNKSGGRRQHHAALHRQGVEHAEKPYRRTR